MRLSIHIIILFVLSNLSGMAQNIRSSIIDDLKAPKSGQGSVVVYQDEILEKLIGYRDMSTSASSTSSDTTGSTVSSNTDVKSISRNFVKAKGYRIQVYSGNNQKLSKSEAYAKRDMIQASYPDTEVSITFNSPFWRVRAGNYRTYEQAFMAMKDLKDSFPSFGREMHIVEDVIKIPVD